MALGKSSLGRVARSAVIPAPERETEQLIANAEPPAPQRPAAEKKPRTRTVAQKASAAAYAVGDELPVWLL